MRITLTLDPDVAERLRQETAHGKHSLKQVVNERLRIGLGLKRGPSKRKYQVKPHYSAYRPGIHRPKINQLVDEIEAETFLKKTISNK